MGLLLYLVAILLDALPIALRFWIGVKWGGSVAGYVLGFGPLVWSFAALLGLPSGGTLTRWELGARSLSEREHAAIDAALHLLVCPKVRRPRRVYVIDAPTVNAHVVGTTLYVERGLLTTPDLVPVLAHELGHLNSLDGRLAHATRRLIFPGTLLLGRLGVTNAMLSMQYQPLGQLSGCGCIGFYLALIIGYVGGVGTSLLLGPLWTRYWWQREYVADAYAARLGQALPLAEVLERQQWADVAAPWQQGRTHPYTEQRIARLQQIAAGEPVRSEMGAYVRLGLLTALGAMFSLPALVCLLLWWVIATTPTQ
jgi:Zn-dependent protease with chaperone function